MSRSVGGLGGVPVFASQDQLRRTRQRGVRVRSARSFSERALAEGREPAQALGYLAWLGWLKGNFLFPGTVSAMSSLTKKRIRKRRTGVGM